MSSPRWQIYTARFLPASHQHASTSSGPEAVCKLRMMVVVVVVRRGRPFTPLSHFRLVFCSSPASYRRISERVYTVLSCTPIKVTVRSVDVALDRKTGTKPSRGTRFFVRTANIATMKRKMRRQDIKADRFNLNQSTSHVWNDLGDLNQETASWSLRRQTYIIEILELKWTGSPYF